MIAENLHRTGKLVARARAIMQSLLIMSSITERERAYNVGAIYLVTMIIKCEHKFEGGRAMEASGLV